MSLRHLRIFIAVAELGNMHAAARKLFIAQPAISQAISEIERFYNVKLFERLSRKLYITPTGEQFLFYARHILALYSDLEQEMSNKVDNFQINIGATITIGTCLMPHIISEFKKSYPRMDLQVSINTADYLAQELLHNGLDIAFVENVYDAQELIAEPFLDDEMILICSPDHPFARETHVSLEEISKDRYIAREKGTQEPFVEYMHLHNLSLNMVWYCNNSETTKMAVMNNYGITCISRLIAAKELAEGSVAEIRLADSTQLTRKMKMLYHKSKYLSDPLLELMDICRNLEVTLPC